MFARKRLQGIPCLSCGYDLTGLPRESVCPECALPIKSTLEADGLLRTWPVDFVQRMSRGLALLAWAPSAIFAGLLLAAWLLVALAAFNFDRAVALALSVIFVGCAGAAACFAMAAVKLADPCAGRPLTPYWPVMLLRITGPLAAILGLVSPIVPRMVLNNERFSAILIAGLCQSVTLAAYAATMRICHALHQRTVLRREKTVYASDWAVVPILGLVWLLGYWIFPGLFPFSLGRTSVDWGQLWSIVVLLAYAIPLWRLRDAVVAEGIVAAYEQGAP